MHQVLYLLKLCVKYFISLLCISIAKRLLINWFIVHLHANDLSIHQYKNRPSTETVHETLHLPHCNLLYGHQFEYTLTTQNV